MKRFFALTWVLLLAAGLVFHGLCLPAPALAQGDAELESEEGDLDADEAENGSAAELRPIEGVFGFRLGERFAPNAEVECRATRHGLVSCPAEAPLPSPYFDTYFLDLDPASRTVTQISAVAAFNDRIDYERARGRVVTLLAAVFGRLSEHQGGLIVVHGATSAFLYGEEDDALKQYALTLLVTDDAAYQSAVERLRSAVPEGGEGNR